MYVVETNAVGSSTEEDTRNEEETNTHVMKAENTEKMLEEVGEKEQRVKCLTKEAEKSSKTCHLQQKKAKKEMQQVSP